MRVMNWAAGAAMAAMLAVAPAAISPVWAQKAQDTLRITWRDTIPVVDPYYNQLRHGLIVAHHAWDGLVYRDPDTFQIKPLLAKSFKWIDETTLEFELRPGVKFHNGDPFTADDVVYTINTVIQDKKVSVPSNYNFYESAERIDELRVRVKLKRVFPAALEYMSMVLPIWPKAYRERVGEEAYAKAPVGAGPYRITATGDNITLERFADYYADSPKGKPAIGKIIITQVADPATEMTRLLGGQADWIWKFTPDQFDGVSRMPNLQAMRSESMRIGFVGMDATGRASPDSPFKNLKVRQAVFHAIDRPTMARQLVQGGSRPLDVPCYPTQFGCDAAAAVKYDYDPAKAKQLLAEAGYPNGFDTELVTYILPQWSGALQGYLQAVGIRAKIAQLTVSAQVARSLKGENPMESADWGSYSINDVSAILPQYNGGGGNDYARDPEVRALVEAGGTTTDPDQRRKNYSAAIKLITERALWMPLFTHSITYGVSKTLNFKPYPDELPRFYLASWR